MRSLVPQAATIAPPTHDSPLKRKRARLERTDSDGVFSFFRRRFYRSASPVGHDENNYDEPEHDHDDENNLVEECSSDDDYDARGLRRVTAIGVDERANDVLLRVARTAAATANVVFFPGDVQDFHTSMISGSYAEYDAFSYEHTAELLAAKFGDAANVWIVRPSRFQFGAFACFDGFVDTNHVGAATAYTANGSAVEQLVTLMENVRALLDHAPEQVHLSPRLPVHLVGFSKGGVVLNQIATEVATRWRGPVRYVDDDMEVDASNQHDDTEANEPIHDDDHDNNGDDHSPRHAARCRQFAAMVASIHWLDSGNGATHGAVPIEQQTLVGLSLRRKHLQLGVHVTPYQFESSERPWIRKEVLHFVNELKQLGANVTLTKYAENEPATLASHFQILREFQLPTPPARVTTRRAHSSEVSRTAVTIQSHA